MARASKWNAEQRKTLLKMVKEGVPEQDIRQKLAISGKAMTAAEFAQQLKMGMVESGQLKQGGKAEKEKPKPTIYEVTSKGRLTITDFEALTGYGVGLKFVLEKPRGRSKAWRLLPCEED